jgi:hypothetical protein
MIHCSACGAARRVKASFRPQPQPDVEAKRREQHELEADRWIGLELTSPRSRRGAIRRLRNVWSPDIKKSNLPSCWHGCYGLGVGIGDSFRPLMRPGKGLIGVSRGNRLGSRRAVPQ